jgi:uncharacterized protein YqjF (DUF2071 family)
MPLATRSERPFLTAEWRNLVMLNFEVDPAILRPRVPSGTELDDFEGRTYVSIVAFRFLKTRIYGRLAIPFHSNFDEVNLRFYVRREERGELRRGVVFIAEIVPRRAIALIARLAYNENYSAYPMTHRITRAADAADFRYAWRVGRSPYEIEASTKDEPALPEASSAEQFITEHYWGYAKKRDGGTVEYRVEHEPWRVWRAATAKFSGEFGALYGAEFSSVLGARPSSAFVAEGSPVKVFSGRRIAD